jgi:hypothetical protein
MTGPTFDRVVALAAGDGEWRIAARMWNAVLRLDVGQVAHLLKIENGRLASHAACPASDPAAVTYTVRVAATGDGWRELLAPVPRPFYQDLYGAMTRHGFAVDGDFETFFAYYPAVRRLVELLRAGQPRAGVA